MIQAARNTKDPKNGSSGKRWQSSRLVGLFFLFFVILIMSVFFWWLISWMEDKNHLPLSKFIITGESLFTQTEDVRKSILSLGEPKTFVSVNVEEVQRRILHDLPWVKNVNVRKEWPDQLRIHLVEYQPVAIWNGHYLIDKNGQVFSIPTSRLLEREYPKFYGPDGSERMLLEGYFQMQYYLAPYQFEISSVVLNDRYAWQLLLSNGIKLELGHDNRMERLERFVTLYPVLKQQTNSEQRILYIDLRYESGAAVSFVPILN